MTLLEFRESRDLRPGGGFRDDRQDSLGVDDLLLSADDGLGLDVDGEGGLQLLEGAEMDER